MFSSTLRVLVLATLVLQGLAACSVSEIRPESVSTVDWPERQALVSKIGQWDVSGRIALQTTDDAWSASIKWQQSRDSYDIQLFGPLGGKALSIQGRENYINLITDKGETFTASSAVDLIYRQTGWQIPVDGLRYWARALPMPEVPAEKIYDQAGRLSELRQSNWTIYYQDYRPIDNLLMPRKIRLESEHFTVKLILKDWQLDTGSRG